MCAVGNLKMRMVPVNEQKRTGAGLKLSVFGDKSCVTHLEIMTRKHEHLSRY